MGRWVVLGGLLALVMLALFATFSEYDIPGFRGAKVIEHNVGTRARAALVAIKADWADIIVDGQKIKLTGEARTEAERDSALGAVGRSIWSGGPIWGGVVQVRDRTSLTPAQSPFTWSASIVSEGRKLRIVGYVPSEAAKSEIYEHAIKLFPTGVEDTSRVARGAPPKSDQSSAANWGLSLLSKLDSGEATFNDTKFILRGVTSNPSVVTFVQSGVANIYQPYIGSHDIALVGEQVPPAVPPADTPPAPESAIPTEPQEPEAKNRSAAAKDCQATVDGIMSNKVIEFDSNAAEIKPSSLPLLDKLAVAASDCPALKLIISGHTDNTGSPDANRSLSRARALAVVTYLRDKGVANGRMTAKGYGQDRPIASNDTNEGKARNRRIQITVID